jgi:hypothetical protein
MRLGARSDDAQGVDDRCCGRSSHQGLTRFKLSKDDADLLLRICPGEKVTRSQMILVFLKYADNNPAKLDDEFPFVAVTAMQQRFRAGEIRPVTTYPTKITFGHARHERSRRAGLLPPPLRPPHRDQRRWLS